MGLFGELFSMAVSEVTNAVMDSVNEVMYNQEEKQKLVEEYRDSYTSLSHDDLILFLQDDNFKEEQRIAIKSILEERKEFAMRICGGDENALAELDDECLMEFYEKIRPNGGTIFPDEYAKDVVRCLQNELVSRPTAIRVYEQRIEGYFEETPYEELETIISGNNIVYDDILKKEAACELECRNQLIEYAISEEIEELDNEDFMQLYNLVRKDITKISYDEIDEIADGECDFSAYKLCNEYFGKLREGMLKNCENELITNRKFLINKFITEYCQDELKAFYNYSDKKLKRILSFEKIHIPEDRLILQVEQYDLCDKLIAKSILSERGGE